MAPIPLGDLVAAAPHTTTPPAAIAALLLPPSESMICDIRAGGMTIGRAELDVGDSEIHSKFSTSSLASMFAVIHHDLATTIDRAHARAQTATETVTVGGETTRTAMAFDGSGYSLDGGEHVGVPAGNAVHTMHSALGWIRAWASASAPASVLYVVEDRDLYRIDLARPTAEDLRGVATFRIDGTIHVDANTTITVTAWVTADSDRRPLRLAIVAGKVHLTAELVS
jgi:hypothetical protein